MKKALLQNIDCLETVLRKSQEAVATFLSNVEHVGDPVPNPQQHWRLKEKKLPVSWRKPFLYLSFLNVETHKSQKKKKKKTEGKTQETLNDLLKE